MMHEFIIKQISNGWILQGPSTTAKGETVGAIGRELFLPTISAVADILEMWQIQGFTKAAMRAADVYKVGR